MLMYQQPFGLGSARETTQTKQTKPEASIRTDLHIKFSFSKVCTGLNTQHAYGPAGAVDPSLLVHYPHPQYHYKVLEDLFEEA